jgi:hypothetical protein
MGEGQLAIPDWELFESEARSRLLDLDDYGDVLPADVAIRIKTAARSVVSAYWDAPDQIQDRLAALRACVGSLLEVVEAARRERDESLAAARRRTRTACWLVVERTCRSRRLRRRRFTRCRRLGAGPPRCRQGRP